MALTMGGSVGGELFNMTCGKAVNDWGRFWSAREQQVGMRAFRDAVAQSKYKSACDYMQNAVRAAERSEDQIRQLRKAEEMLVEARNDLLPWAGSSPEMRDSLLHCLHILICVTYWIGSDMGRNPGAGVKRAFYYFEKLLELVAVSEMRKAWLVGAADLNDFAMVSRPWRQRLSRTETAPRAPGYGP
jgi:hypothetical protein